jgi:hypothetical protein
MSFINMSPVDMSDTDILQEFFSLVKYLGQSWNQEWFPFRFFMLRGYDGKIDPVKVAKISLALKALRELGPRQLGLYALYQAGLWTGYFR